MDVLGFRMSLGRWDFLDILVEYPGELKNNFLKGSHLGYKGLGSRV